MKLDNLDIEILMLLQQNSDRTIKSIAEEMKLSTTPIFERIKKLKKEGYIANYIARLNHKKLEKAFNGKVWVQNYRWKQPYHLNKKSLSLCV